MKIKTILNDFLVENIPSIHKTRQSVLIACVHSVINDGSLTVTSMGRGIDSDAIEKHNIKRSGRLCSNPNLQREKSIFMVLFVKSGSQ
ncbi:MAG: hypothetical protein OCD00_16880 [Colwellia sp.]